MKARRVLGLVLLVGITFMLTGCEIVIHFPNQPPVASFIIHGIGGFAPLVVFFDASGSYDPDGSIQSYQWSFGDGSTGAGVSLSHHYRRGGYYTVTLLVVDNNGATSRFNAVVEIRNPPPIAFFTSFPLRVNIGQEVYFDAARSYDPAALEKEAESSPEGISPIPGEPFGKIVLYQWDFGDGMVVETPLRAVSYAYSSSGIHNVTLVVIDDHGAHSNPFSQSVSVNWPPVAVISARPCPPVTRKEPIILRGNVARLSNVLKGIIPEPNDVCWELDGSSSYDPDGGIIRHEWRWGDVFLSQDPIIQLSFAPGVAYTITLIVTDNEGAVDATFITIGP